MLDHTEIPPPRSSDFVSVVDRGWEFQQELRSLKDDPSHAGFPWYPYDSLSNLVHMSGLIDALPEGWERTFGVGPILEVGAGDGDLSFFLERLGYAVHAVDHPFPNHNGMRGIRRLKAALDSRIEVLERDLEGAFVLPERFYEVGLMFGLLYHLKNPIHVLERLARSVRFLFVSTRVARYLPSGANIESESAAYLVGSAELNEDPSNYWIFSPCSLRRMIERSHWRVLRIQFAGDLRASDPISPEHDERAYCLLESSFGEVGVDLESGWHDPEETGWRWTERTFSVNLPAASARRELELEIYVHERLVAEAGVLELVALQEGESHPLAVFSIQSHGPASLRVPVPAAAGAADSRILLRFEASSTIPADAADPRERCLIVARMTVAGI